jgi:hypothetical protein
MNPLLRTVLLVVVTTGLQACGDLYYTAAPIEAWVVDADTGAPIEGAVVTANWQLIAFGFDTGGRKQGQLEVMETVTDKNGRFQFPGFTKLNLSGNALGEEDPQILIFKPGYRHIRATNQYPIGEEESQGPRRRSSIIGQRLKMQPAGDDVKKYANNLGFLGSALSSLQDQSDVVSRIPRMIHALECERLRLRRLDSSIALIDVPGPPPREKECASD